MSWKFWASNRQNEKTETESTEQLSTQLTEMKEMVNKLTRLQYKTNQDMLGKLERLGVQAESAVQWQAEQKEANEQIRQKELSIESAIVAMIGWLDDLDYIMSGDQEKETAVWHQVFSQWRDQLLSTLETLGVRELRVLGKSFDPRMAESVQAVSKETLDRTRASETIIGQAQTYAAYEVVGIMKRGFVRQDGSLLRKAQVITLKEE